ncbi:hypothetical protein GCM10018781_32280 [Kitasatospora indigofera]|uniref:Uncharacterized protein n=1 Tax=Kitasatospora indigofera TaxID=67307 RepID=A0A919FSR2_9ACTN|nr:hypothetical protein GCM10018781_32280 [Kitasatospora indigofera]
MVPLPRPAGAGVRPGRRAGGVSPDAALAHAVRVPLWASSELRRIPREPARTAATALPLPSRLVMDGVLSLMRLLLPQFDDGPADTDRHAGLERGGRREALPVQIGAVGGA